MKLEVADVDGPLERSAAARLRRLARLDRALQGRFRAAGPRFRTGRHLCDLDPRPLELRFRDHDPMRLQRERLDLHAGAIGAEHAVSFGIPKLHGVRADVQEAADVDGAEAQVALDRIARFVRHVPAQPLGTAAGVQPDERRSDRQQDGTEQCERHNPQDSGELAPARREVPPAPRRRQRRLVPRFWQLLGHCPGILATQTSERTWKARSHRRCVDVPPRGPS